MLTSRNRIGAGNSQAHIDCLASHNTAVESTTKKKEFFVLCCSYFSKDDASKLALRRHNKLVSNNATKVTRNKIMCHFIRTRDSDYMQQAVNFLDRYYFASSQSDNVKKHASLITFKRCSKVAANKVTKKIWSNV